MPFVNIKKDNGEIINWNVGGRKFGEPTRKQRRLSERLEATGRPDRSTKRPHNNRKGGPLRDQKIQQRHAGAFRRLMRLTGEEV